MRTLLLALLLCSLLTSVTLAETPVVHSSQMPPAQRKALAKKILSDKNFPLVRQKAFDILKTGFNAGDGYGQVWIRDLNTFILMSTKVNDQATIKSNLLKFFEFQGDDGNIVDGFVSSTNKTHKNTVETDQETSLIQAVHKYIKATNDRSILTEKIKGKSVLDRMEMALQFLMNHRLSKKYGLLWGATTADWGDVQPKDSWGVYLSDTTDKSIDIYDNAMFIIALDNFIDLAGQDSKAPVKWKSVLTDIKRNTRKHLWTGNKFIPHLYLDKSPWPADFDENKIYYFGGTAIAIEAGLLNREEIALSIHQMVTLKQKANAQSIGLTLYPAYPKGFFKNPQMFNPYSYQNGGDWTWFGGRMIQQMIAQGFIESAYEELTPMTDRVIKNKGFFEWYTVDGKPKGSGTFRGSAGVLGDAIKMLTDWAKQNNQS